MVTQDIPLCDAPHFTRLVNALKLLTIDILVQEIHSVKTKFELEIANWVYIEKIASHTHKIRKSWV